LFYLLIYICREFCDRGSALVFFWVLMQPNFADNLIHMLGSDSLTIAPMRGSEYLYRVLICESLEFSRMTSKLNYFSANRTPLVKINIMTMTCEIMNLLLRLSLSFVWLLVLEVQKFLIIAKMPKTWTPSIPRTKIANGSSSYDLSNSITV
jgi:hypothetical protein